MLYAACFLKEKGLLRIPLTLLFSPEDELCSPEVYLLFKRELANCPKKRENSVEMKKTAASLMG